MNGTTLDLSAINVHDVEATAEHKRLQKMQAKIRRKERKLNEYVAGIAEKSDETLRKRKEIIERETNEEVARSLQNKNNFDTWARFAVEVDTAIQKNTNLRAARDQRRLKKIELIPTWMSCLDEIVSVVKMKGHADKSRWRSITRKLMLQCIEGCEKAGGDEKFIQDVVLTVKKLVLEINTYTSGAMLTEVVAMKALFIEWIEKLLPPEEADIIHSPTESLVQIEAEIDNCNDSVPASYRNNEFDSINSSLVPLSFSNWSNELLTLNDTRLTNLSTWNCAIGESGMGENSGVLDNITMKDTSQVSGQLENPSVISNGVNISMFSPETKASPSSSIFSHSMVTGLTNPTQLGVGKSDSPKSQAHFPESISDNQAKAVVQLRIASANGDFPFCWAIVHRVFDGPKRKKVVVPSKLEKSSHSTTSNPRYHAFKQKMQKRNHVDNKTVSDPKIATTTLQLPTPGRSPISLPIFKLLMVAFKNSSGLDFQQARKVFHLMKAYDISPDISIYNSLLMACVRDSRWRRALNILQDLRKIHSLTPNSFSFEIIIDCIRHALDPPAVIYETLRNEKLPPL